MEISTRPVTLADIARDVGVTSITVHNALGGKGRVSAATRARIVERAREMGYESNQIARSLATGQAMALGVLSYKIASPLAAQQLAGIEAQAQNMGYHVVIAAHRHDPQRALSILSDMSARRLSGVISLSSTADMVPGVAEGLRSLRLPTVFSFHQPPTPDCADCVTVDQEQGAALAVRTLIEAGRQKIAFLGGPQSRAVTRGRWDGARSALREVGLDASRAAFAPDFFVADGLESARELLADKPDAIFCASDNLAAAVLRAARQNGMHVPDDVAVIGFDNSPVCEALDPPLTSVAMPLEDVGRECVNRLLRRIEYPDDWEPLTVRLSCRLVARESA